MKVKLMLLHKEFIELKIPILEGAAYSPVHHADDYPVVLKDVTYFERILELPDDTDSTFDSIKVAYKKWFDDYQEKKKSIELSNHMLAVKFQGLLTNPPISFNQESFYIKALELQRKNKVDAQRELWVWWSRQNGYQEPLEDIEFGDIINYQIL